MALNTGEQQGEARQSSLKKRRGDPPDMAAEPGSAGSSYVFNAGY